MKTLTDFFDKATYQKAEQLSVFLLNEKPFTVKDAGMRNSEVQFWIRQGLFPDSENWNVSLSFVQFVWLRILSELRELGTPVQPLEALYRGLVEPISNYSLYEQLSEHPGLIENMSLPEDEINNLKTYLQSGNWKKKVGDMPDYSPLHLLIAEAIVKRCFVNIAVFSKGDFLPVIDDSFEMLPVASQRRFKTQTHITVSITNILSSMLGDERFAAIVPKLGHFTDEEMKLLEQVRSGNYDAIKIRFSNKKMDLIEMEKSQDVHRRLVDILSENQFQSISLQTHNGKVTRITNTVKIKV